MSKTIQIRVEGWIPLAASLVQAEGIGLIGAAVYGWVWKYCQTEHNGVCDASLDTIAAGLGLTRQTVSKYVSFLVKEGYLLDLTPGVRHKPHAYADTGKAQLDSAIYATLFVEPGCIEDLHQNRRDSTNRYAESQYDESHIAKPLQKSLQTHRSLP